MSGEDRVSGREAITPATLAEQAQLLKILQGPPDLPMGRTGGVEVSPYRRKDPATGFYAALIAIQAARTESSPVDEGALADEARRRSLLGEHGAETAPDDYGPQRQFVKEHLGLDILFIDPAHPTLDTAEECIKALVSEQQLIFGILDRWVILDGLHRTNRRTMWTVMDPTVGRRVEHRPENIRRHLNRHALPLVVVEACDSPPPSPRRLLASVTQLLKPAWPRRRLESGQK